jgi:tRNA (cmo5U34)-methyltransferase
MSSARDETMPDGAWKFDAAVADVFDDMLARSIPEYETMRRAVIDVATPHVRRGASIVDLGCARGGALAAFVERFESHNRYFGVDTSEPMLAAARERFATMPELVCIEHMDLRHEYPDAGACCVTLCVLTLQFIAINYRQRILQRVFDHLLPGAAFVLVEKVLGASAEIDERLIDIYHAHKREQGYSADAIARKALALEGVLVPVTAGFNEQMLRVAGFREVDCFWRHMNFAGWLAIKSQ